jgi:hypothetical protein
MQLFVVWCCLYRRVGHILFLSTTKGKQMQFTNEEKFIKMMAPNINCWMSSYYVALDYVADLVINDKVTITKDSKFAEVAKPFVTEEFDLDSIANLLYCFKIFAFEDSVEIGDSMGITSDDLTEADLSLWDFINLFAGDPKKTAELLVKAKHAYIPIYSTKENN